jgi:hypothetical protein
MERVDNMVLLLICLLVVTHRHRLNCEFASNCSAPLLERERLCVDGDCRLQVSELFF